MINFKKNISPNKNELSNSNKKKINKNLIFHNLSKSNQLFLNNDKKDNYILNGYKNIEKDQFLSLIKKDVAHLRFRIKTSNDFNKNI